MVGRREAAGVVPGAPDRDARTIGETLATVPGIGTKRSPPEPVPVIRMVAARPPAGWSVGDTSGVHSTGRKVPPNRVTLARKGSQETIRQTLRPSRGSPRNAPAPDLPVPPPLG